MIIYRLVLFVFTYETQKIPVVHRSAVFVLMCYLVIDIEIKSTNKIKKQNKTDDRREEQENECRQRNLGSFFWSFLVFV